MLALNLNAKCWLWFFVCISPFIVNSMIVKFKVYKDATLIFTFGVFFILIIANF